MKIIDAGHNVAWSLRLICRGMPCAAVLEIEESDLHFVNNAMGYAGETWEPQLYVVCPVCGALNYVTWDVSTQIRERKFAGHKPH